MTKATPPTAPNLATSRQKSEASPRIRSASALNMTLHGRQKLWATRPKSHFSPHFLGGHREQLPECPACRNLPPPPGRKGRIRPVFGRLADVTFPVIGVVGGGQLARMMAPAATALGFELRVLAEGDDVSAVSAVPATPVGDYKDLQTLLDFSKGLDVMTFDHEHVPTDHLRALQEAGVNVQPGPHALVHAQDKLVMR